MSIPRWHHRLNRPGMFESPEGVYVHHSDHAAAVARLREAGDEMAEHLQSVLCCFIGPHAREALAAWREAVKESE